ncbi:MAG: hypothetical protein Q4G11_07060, partial [Gallicola sp.]|nr:hypothetical protein [Gallicola sp.]
TMDISHEYLSFKPVLAKDAIGNVEKVVDMAKRKSLVEDELYFAGVNVDFFNMGGDNRILK